jgi:O-antigen biosynthesis protein
MLKLLLTTHHLTNYGGSELVTLDLANEFKQIGWDVIVATFQLGGEIEKDFKTSGVEIFNVLNDPLPQVEFDLVWSHHYPVLIKCLIEDSITTKSLILSSLSPYEPLEAIPFFHTQADLILCNSDETRQEIIKDENYNNFDESKLFVFKNSVPFNWFNLSLDRKGLELKKVAIISNHPPIEILEAINILKTKGIDADLIGIHGTPKLVNIDLLTSYDAIVTIGRTTQHCMALNIPVFCYDRFGGPGWLTPANFQLAEWFNYSGRCCHQKISSQQIVTELIEGFSKAKGYGEFFKTYSINNYLLKNNIDAVLEFASIANRCSQPYITFDNEKVIGKVGKAYQNILKDKEALKDELDRSQAESIGSQLQLQQAQVELTRLQSQLQQARADLQNYLNIIKSMETSKFWQLREVWLQVKKVFRYFGKS